VCIDLYDLELRAYIRTAPDGEKEAVPYFKACGGFCHLVKRRRDSGSGRDQRAAPAQPARQSAAAGE
jgi:hypothetical protein